MPEKTYLQAISDGLRQEMRRDKRVFVIGEDVGVYGGAFKVTLGFQEEFGPWRVIDAPLSETAIVGGCTGAAIMGMRPVAEMQFADFISCAWDHLVTVAAKQRWRAGTPVPITVRLPSGGGFSGGPFHSQNPESSFAHIPGLKVICPATPEDAKGLLATAIQDPSPCLYFEHKHLYRRLKAEVPDERFETPFGKARIHREGEDVSVITWGAMVHTAAEAAQQLEGEDISVEIIDLRTLSRGTSRQSWTACRRPPRWSCCTRTPTPAASAARSRRRSRRRHSRTSTRPEADRGARLAGAVLAAAREGLHPAGRGRRRRDSRGGRVLMAATASIDVVMPQMGVSVSEGTITKWLKQEGETVAADESLLEISTDKVDTEVPSPGSGVVQQILVQEGETVEVGTKLAVIAPEGAAPAEQRRRLEPEPAAQEPAAEAAAERGAEAPAPEAAPPPPEPSPHPRRLRRPRPRLPTATVPGRKRSSRRSSRASPRSTASMWTQVSGTGRGGRVTKKDILAFVESGSAQEAQAPQPEPQAAAPAAPAAPPEPVPAPEPQPAGASGPGRRAATGDGAGRRRSRARPSSR